VSPTGAPTTITCLPRHASSWLPEIDPGLPELSDGHTDVLSVDVEADGDQEIPILQRWNLRVVYPDPE
jgi:hypothetical protein